MSNPLITKTRYYTHPYVWNGQLGYSTYVRESIAYYHGQRVRGFYTGFNPCTHTVTLPGAHYKDHWNNLTATGWSLGSYVPWNSIRSYALSQRVAELDFQKNNEFELIPFLVDWDDTLRIFSIEFWKKLSYGSVKWGLMPFVSDIRSLAASLEDINSGILKSYDKLLGQKITRRKHWSWEQFPGVCSHKVKGVTTINGYLTGGLPEPGSIIAGVNIILDELGLHPDLATAWEVAPLSFIIDYFLPVGDFLESMSPRGWFNPSFNVTGGYSLKYEIEQTPNGPQRSGSPCTYMVYDRQPGAFTVPSRAPKLPEFSAPSWTELFDTFYVARKRFI